MILPSEGCELFVADFSKIEVAVLWWLADNLKGLAILNSGKDPYRYQAAANTGKTYEEISEEGDERQLGKAQILGCGFRMSWKRFRETAWDQYRLKLTVAQSKAAVRSYREINAPVTKLWDDYELAAIAAVETGEVAKAGKCKFFTKDNFLWIELPGGKRLAYRDPQISWRVLQYEDAVINEETGEIELDENGVEIFETKFSQPRKTLEFWAVNSKTKKWSLERSHGGVITENIVQAVARGLQMEAALRLEKKQYRYLLGVHDEAITEKKIGTGSIEEFEAIMCQMPIWADENLPLQAKAWIGPRYRK